MFDAILSWLNSMGSSVHHPAALALLTLAPVLEYVFPPFPGDSVTLLGAILVSVYHWNLILIFSLLMLGSLVGSFLAFEIGRRWGRRRAQKSGSETRLSALIARFRKHGPYYLLLNRFIPGLRPLFFVAAGLAGMKTRQVLVLSGISAFVWNALLMSAGAAVGNNLETLQAWMRNYSKAAYSVLLLLALLLGLHQILRWARS